MKQNFAHLNKNDKENQQQQQQQKRILMRLAKCCTTGKYNDSLITDYQYNLAHC